uniref:Uncharacterized protein n=1 Tax=Arundo donax TaxID=35708 RepID=A0A0A9HQD9_ARUDO
MKVAKSPHARHSTLPLTAPTPSRSDVPADSSAAVPRPNSACAIRPPSNRPIGSRFSDVTTMPRSPANASGSTGTPTPSTALGSTFPSSSAYGPITSCTNDSSGLL